MKTTLSSPQGTIAFGSGLPTLLINDQLRVMDQKADILDQLLDGNLDGLVELARFGQAVGMDMVDILVNHPGLNEVDLLPRIARRITDEVGCPISLDSRDPQALEAALQEIRPYKALINSVSAEEDVLENLLPIAQKYRAAIIGMPMGRGRGLPMTVEERLFEARIILEAALGVGIPRENIVMDAMCLAVATGPGTFELALNTLVAFHNELCVTTILGIGNAGYGMPDHTVIDLAYLIGAIPYGLDAALVDPHTSGLVETVRAMDFLCNRDPAGKRYIAYYRAKRKLDSTI
jgi:5-methyltetrahydrofolate--homocysteine methyltransferase